MMMTPEKNTVTPNSILCVTFFMIVLAIQMGCGSNEPSVIQETSEYSFEDMAEMAARDTELSEAGEDSDEK
tara:strand:- start:484 stop:696 length:213 start_codon:yes stop_codon:yes gene_type:complete